MKYHEEDGEREEKNKITLNIQLLIKQLTALPGASVGKICP
jgi:hypothetical protein